MILAVLAGGTGATSTPVPSPSASPLSILTNQCSTAQLSNIVAAYLPATASGIMATPTPVPIPANVEGYLAHILRQRLMQCWAQLGGHRPLPKVYPPKVPTSPEEACWPSDSENAVAQLWAHLKFCESLVHPAVKAPPAGIGWQLPSTTGSGSRPVIFVMGIGDPAMVGRLVSALVTFLNEGVAESGFAFVDNAVLVPQPSWQLETFATQCANSPQVRGAIVVDVTASGGGTTDQFITRKNWTAVEATAFYAQCTHDPEDAQGTSAFTWASDIVKEEHHRLTLTPLTPLAMLLTMASIYEVFAPAHTTSTASTSVFPNPSPVPSGGRVTQVVTTNQTTLNASSLGSVAGGFLGSSITYTNSAVPISQQPVDELTWDTLQSVAIGLMSQMNCWHPTLGPKQTAIANGIVGAPRTLPAYNPPKGLGAYSSGKASAPFCSEPTRSESITDILPAAPR